jgi:hypothetical protein
MVLEIRRDSGQTHGVVPRVAKELGIGVESLRNLGNRAEVDSGRQPGPFAGDSQRIGEFKREVRELR